SKIFDIVKGLNEYGVEVSYVDEQADRNEAKQFYGIDIMDIDQVNDADCLVFAVAHKEFKELSKDRLNEMYDSNLNDDEKVLIDVKGIFDSGILENSGVKYWSL